MNMADTFQFELVAPEKLLLSEQAVEVQLPGSEGYLTVMANHAPTMTRLMPGVVRVKIAGKDEKAFVVFGGFADITPQSCAILAEAAHALEAFDPAELEERIAAAKAELDGATNDEHRNRAEDFLYELTTVRGVLTMA